MIHKSKVPTIQVNLRIQPALKKRLAAAARKSGRSFNAELAERLEESLERDTIGEVLQELHFALEEQDKQRLEFQKVFHHYLGGVADYIEMKMGKKK